MKISNSTGICTAESIACFTLLFKIISFSQVGRTPKYHYSFEDDEAQVKRLCKNSGEPVCVNTNRIWKRETRWEDKNFKPAITIGLNNSSQIWSLNSRLRD